MLIDSLRNLAAQCTAMACSGKCRIPVDCKRCQLNIYKYTRTEEQVAMADLLLTEEKVIFMNNVGRIVAAEEQNKAQFWYDLKSAGLLLLGSIAVAAVVTVVWLITLALSEV